MAGNRFWNRWGFSREDGEAEKGARGGREWWLEMWRKRPTALKNHQVLVSRIVFPPQKLRQMIQFSPYFHQQLVHTWMGLRSPSISSLVRGGSNKDVSWKFCFWFSENLRGEDEPI